MVVMVYAGCVLLGFMGGVLVALLLGWVTWRGLRLEREEELLANSLTLLQDLVDATQREHYDHHLIVVVERLAHRAQHLLTTRVAP